MPKYQNHDESTVKLADQFNSLRLTDFIHTDGHYYLAYSLFTESVWERRFVCEAASMNIEWCTCLKSTEIRDFVTIQSLAVAKFSQLMTGASLSLSFI